MSKKMARSTVPKIPAPLAAPKIRRLAETVSPLASRGGIRVAVSPRHPGAAAMTFTPSYCPNDLCPSRSRRSFRWVRRGFFRRACDGRAVQRFRCLHCGKFFSVQTFRLDYRLRLPELHWC